MGDRVYINGGPGNDVLVGSDATNDAISGGAGNDIMRGLGDTDLLTGGAGDDTYDGGDGDDYAFFDGAPNGVHVDLAITGPQDTGEGRDTFISIESIGGSAYADVLYGNDGVNWIYGNAGDDVIFGRGGNDFLTGDAGNDELHGGAGADIFDGGTGNDRLFGDDGNDIFFLTQRGDTVIDGGAGFDTIAFFNTTSGITLDLGNAANQSFVPFQWITLKNVEKVQATPYNDVLTGDANDNTFSGSGGNDVIDGRGGYDTVLVGGFASEFSVAWTVDGWRITDLLTGLGRNGVTLAKNVEWLQFGGGGGIVLGDGMSQLVTGLLRRTDFSGSLMAHDLSTRLDSGALTPGGALAEVIKTAGATTSVATLSYEFFTGKIPGQAGVDYLVSPGGPNTNNLNSAYYQSFNLENRYINFAVNLGKIGEGKEAFAAKYGAMSLFDATREAYKTIFGAAPTDTKIHALIDSRADYFAIYGGDGVSGIGTKAAMVGWLLAEAEKADIGVMVRSNDAWLTDLADGSAPFAIDILDPAKGYWKADFVFGGT